MSRVFAATIVLVNTLCSDAVSQDCGRCEYRIAEASVTVGASGEEIPFLVTNSDVAIFALQLAFSFDTSKLGIVDVSREGTASELADFFAGGVDSENGIAAFAILFDLGGDFSGKFLVSGEDTTVLRLFADVTATEETTTTLTFGEVQIDAVSTEPVENLMTNPLGESIFPDLLSGTITLESRPRDVFLRGDADDNEVVNITDGIFVLNYLFLAGPDARCRDAMDIDDSGGVIVTDAVFVFNYLFLAGALPPAPFPEPGLDLSDDPLPPCSGL